MLHPSSNLNPKLFDTDVEQVYTRKGFGEGLLIAGEKDERVYGLCADLTESTQMHLFKKKFPNRFVEIGVAEQNMASVASGLAAMGKIPAITSYATFSPGRNWEQIRTTICYNNRKVIIAGSHAGLSVGPDGGSHQALEDIALMRVVPNMSIIYPCDVIEARKATLAAFDEKQKTPVYIRLAREKTPVMTTEATPFVFGKANIFYVTEGVTDGVDFDVLICTTGPLTHNALRAAVELEKEHKKKVVVLNFHTIKPFDEEALVKFAKHAQKVVTVEEHQIVGGFGSAVCEVLSEQCPRQVVRIGVHDRFGQSGTATELIREYKLDVKDIVGAAL